MSTSQIINQTNKPSNVILADYLAKVSMKMLVKIRFDKGQKICENRLMEALLIERLVCENLCYFDEDDNQRVRDRLIQISILDLDEL